MGSTPEHPSPMTVSILPDRPEVFRSAMPPGGWFPGMFERHHPSGPRNMSVAGVFHEAGHLGNRIPRCAWTGRSRRCIQSPKRSCTPAPQIVPLGRRRGPSLPRGRSVRDRLRDRLPCGSGKRTVCRIPAEMSDKGVTVKSGNEKNRRYLARCEEVRHGMAVIRQSIRTSDQGRRQQGQMGGQRAQIIPHHQIVGSTVRCPSPIPR